MTRDQEISIEQKARATMSEITMNDHGLDIARAAHEKWYAPIREYLRTAPQSAFATSLHRRRSHREYCEVRALVRKYAPTLDRDFIAHSWAERTTEAQGPIEQRETSSLHCHGPPRDMVRGMTQALTNQIASTVRRTKESLTV